MIYVAAPYGHSDPKVTEYRMSMVHKALALFLKEGRHAISPLLMHHVLKVGVDLPNNFEFWDEFCFDILDRCDSMAIITLPGWDTSRGVLAEIEFCNERDIPVGHITLDWIASKIEGKSNGS